ncbi:glutamate ABC transporter substrate-binding protein [Embleya sp. NBC_00896]|uniref:glutamate ABC transporter substrate-binding protein n=1 Tax=Embleya sp. NBC_00896 TaxID=2975961 RepID=UPI0038688171|nr:glutamate ABC transporter substrate-binding protein [Embleya sp. NBC_00896]
MKMRSSVAIAGIAVLALFGTACGKDGSPEAKTPGGTGGGTAGAPGATKPELPSYTAKEGVALTGSKTFDNAKKRGKLIVGVKADQPFLGSKDPATGKYSGFDIEITKMIAADLGFAPDKIEYKEIASTNRENELVNGTVDYYVGTYSITDKRKQQVSFAGPYYIAGQSLLVRKNENAITGKDTIKGKTVCSAKGSTPLQNLQNNFPDTTTRVFDTYSLCVESLLSNQVDAVSTDDAILKGYAAKDPGALKVVGEPFTTENYGVGLNKDDAVFRNAVTDALENHEKNGDWLKAYNATLGLSGSAAPAIPALVRS